VPEDGFGEQVGIEEVSAPVVVRVLGLFAVGVELRLRKRSRELIIGLVVGDTQGDIQGISRIVPDAAACASRRKLGAIPIPAASKDLHR